MELVERQRTDVRKEGGRGGSHTVSQGDTVTKGTELTLMALWAPKQMALQLHPLLIHNPAEPRRETIKTR